MEERLDLKGTTMSRQRKMGDLESPPTVTKVSHDVMHMLKKKMESKASSFSTENFVIFLSDLA